MRLVKVFTQMTVIFLSAMLLLSVPAAPVLAQDAEYRLDLRRDFGYGNGSDVRGNFSMTVHGPQEPIVSVTYLIDGEGMGQVDQAPYRISFVTSDYADGWHDLAAVVETVDGQKITTPAVRINFISAAQQSTDFTRIFGILFGLILIMAVVGIAAQSSILRGDKHIAPGTPRKYGLQGGTICPRCDRPYAIHLWSIGLIAGRLDRCDHCGKWAFVQRHSPDMLAAAERAERKAAQASEASLPGAAEESEEEKMRRLLDESRYGKL